MRLSCPNCGAEYDIPDGMIPAAGRHVQCTSCHTRWFAKAPVTESLSEDEILTRLQSRGTRPPVDPFVAATSVPAPVHTSPMPPAQPSLAAARPAPAWPDTAPPSPARPQEPRADNNPPTTLRPAASVVPLRPLAPAKPASQPMAARPSVMRPTALEGPVSAPPIPSSPAPQAAPVQAPRLTLDPAPAMDASPAAETRGTSLAFGMGAALALALLVAALGVYDSRNRLAAAVPAAEPALRVYGSTVDEIRVHIEEQLAPLREAAASPQ